MNYEREFAGQPPLPKQPMCEVGQLTCQYTGAVFSQSVVNAYNKYTQDFNRSRWRAEQEFLLDQRHRFIRCLFGILCCWWRASSLFTLSFPENFALLSSKLDFAKKQYWFHIFTWLCSVITALNSIDKLYLWSDA